MEEKLNRLRRFNLFMALLHFGQGVAMLVLSSSFSLPVMTSFLKFDYFTYKLVPDPTTMFDLRIGPVIAAFLFLSSLAHLLIGTTFNNWYNENLKKGMNIARWVEYSFSSSIMIVVISMLVGLYDISTLLLVFFLNMMMILFGWMMELHNQSTGGKTNWTSFIFGCICLLYTSPSPRD